jgi:hypothetical protein
VTLLHNRGIYVSDLIYIEIAGQKKEENSIIYISNCVIYVLMKLININGAIKSCKKINKKMNPIN